MIEEQASVVSIQQDNAILELARQSPCGLCGKTKGCGIAMWGRFFGHQNHQFQVKNTIHAQVGDDVVIGLEDHALVINAFVLYGVPLFALMLGAALVSLMYAGSEYSQDLVAILGALVGLVLGTLWLKIYSTGKGVDSRFQPVMLRRADQRVIQIKCNE